MREPGSSRRETSALAWIIGVLIAAFVVQNIAVTQGGEGFITRYLMVTRRLGDGYVWTLFTYGFLHADLLHIILNLLGVFLLGRTMLPIMGTQRFIAFGFAAMAVGGVAAYVVSVLFVGYPNLLGASAAICGLLAVFGTLYPEQRIGFLLLPWTIKARHAVLGFAALSLILMAAFERSGTMNGSFSHSAHLGGMLAGWLYGRYVHHRTGEFSIRPSIELPAWMRRRKRTKARVVPAFTVNVTPSPQNLRAEVDRILDKINSEGFGSLTPEERRILDNAGDLLNRR